jgi:glutamate-ammonia-ligase adenylyltransferase
LLAALRQQRELASALRVLRQLVLERLAVLDLNERAPLAVVTGGMTLLAEFCLGEALTAAQAELQALHGVPRNAEGQDIAFWVLGMGKLGARELNVSSDIDLVYVYEEEGESDGPRPLSTAEYFGRLAKRLYALVGEVSEDGQVFRMDLALRPNGNSGAPCVSLAALEAYFVAQGREWERLAWLKSRVVAPRDPASLTRARQLRDLISPFVYRRYLDYSVFEGLRVVHRKIREEAQRRAAGRPERANDVKLSRGGIREIEFIVQLLQVVRGGQFPEIRTRSTLKALGKLAAAGLMKPELARLLAQDYELLRAIEHRAQYLDDQQTHLLPADDTDLRWMADSLGLGCKPGACELLDRLCEARERVAAEFDALLHDGRPNGGGCKGCGGSPAGLDEAEFAERLPAGLREAVQAFAGRPRVQALREEARTRLAQLFVRAGQTMAAGDCSAEAGARFVDWLEPLLRRDAYLALLAERPAVLTRLLRLLGLARWPMRYLIAAPRRDRRTGRRTPAARALRPCRLLSRAGRPPRRLAARRRGARRGAAARRAAPGAARRGVPHPGARRGRAHHGGAGRRRPQPAGRRRAADRHRLGLVAPRQGATARTRASPSSPTASWAARSWATAPTSTWSFSTTTPRSPTPTWRWRPTPASCASWCPG